MQMLRLHLEQISESMPEVIRQLPFFIAMIALSWWLFPDDTMEELLGEFDIEDLVELTGSFSAFLIACLTAYVVALDSKPAN